MRQNVSLGVNVSVFTKAEPALLMYLVLEYAYTPTISFDRKPILQVCFKVKNPSCKK